MKTIEEQNIEFQEQANKLIDSAFPAEVRFQYEANPQMHFFAMSKGLSKRELYAALILSGHADREGNYAHFAKHAVAQADALIEELSKETK